MKYLSQVLCDILEAIGSPTDRKMVLNDFDLFKMVFLTYPLLQDSTDRVLLSLLFTFQNRMSYLQRVIQDLATILELKDSLDYFPSLQLDLISSTKKSRKSVAEVNILNKMNSQNFSVMGDEREIKAIFFEELVEFKVCEAVRVNSDRLKLLAIFYLEKICQIFNEVCLNHQNFLQYYCNAKRHMPFDPYLVLLTGFENTKSKQIKAAIRDSFNSLTKYEYFSKNEFSFKIDLFDMRNTRSSSE